MKIKQYHIYKLKNILIEDLFSQVVVVQNNKANELTDFVVVVGYVDGEFKGVHTVEKYKFIEEVGMLSEDKHESLREYYYSFVAG